MNRDVARAAGVSQGTASNVFNRPALVRPEVRERVEEAARELGYSGPDPKGRLLRAGKFNAIGVVPPGAFGITSPFLGGYCSQFSAGVAEVCDEMGAALTLISGIDDAKVAGIRNALVDGFILHNIEDVAFVEPARRRKLPFVAMDIDGDADTNTVRIDDRGGARLAAEHLVKLGHRHFVIVSVLRENRPGPIFHAAGDTDHRLVGGFPHDRDRLAGYADVLEKAGISMNDVPIIETRGSGEVAAVFEKAPEATAALAMSDTQALWILSEARRRNIHVPRDLSVVGFDDASEAALADPPLTTVVQPSVEKGRVAARILFEGGPPQHVVLPVKLIVRGSTAPPPS